MSVRFSAGFVRGTDEFATPGPSYSLKARLPRRRFR